MAPNVFTQNVSRETFNRVDQLWSTHFDKLNYYIDLLLDHNSRVNLISRKLSREEVVFHVKHSILPSALLFFANDTIWDAGTGGGLPGIPLAIINPDKHFILHDKSSKKIKIVEQIIDQLQLTNCSTHLEDLNNVSFKKPVTLVSKHSFKLDDFIKRSNKLNWSDAVFLKGNNFLDELNNDHIKQFDITCYKLDNGGALYSEKVMLVIQKR